MASAFQIKNSTTANSDIVDNVSQTVMSLQQEWEISSAAIHRGLSDWLAQAAPGNGAQGYLDKEELIRKILQDSSDATVAYGDSVRKGGEANVDTDGIVNKLFA